LAGLSYLGYTFFYGCVRFNFLLNRPAAAFLFLKGFGDVLLNGGFLTPTDNLYKVQPVCHFAGYTHPQLAN